DDQPRGLCINIGLVDRIALLIKHLARLAADDHATGTPIDDLLDRLRLKIIGGQPLWRRKYQLIAARGISILMKIKRRAARLIRKPNDPVPRIRIDPFTRKLFRLSMDESNRR